MHVATSVYANVAGIDDRITTVPGSFARTVANLKKLVAKGVPVRAGVIAMEENRHVVEETMAFLRGCGVWNVGSDGLREIGRGATTAEHDMAELCGQCAGGKICVAPNGLVSPCIMSKAWSVGSIVENSLGEIVHSTKLRDKGARSTTRLYRERLTSSARHALHKHAVRTTLAVQSRARAHAGRAAAGYVTRDDPTFKGNRGPGSGV